MVTNIYISHVIVLKILVDLCTQYGTKRGQAMIY